MRIFLVDFEGLYPVGSTLVIKAKDFIEAKKIVSETITHTNLYDIKEVNLSSSGVIVYLSGDY
jgi:hypothetical protein